MKKIPFLTLLLTVFSTSVSTNKLLAQEAKTTVLQDSRFEILLKEKRRINSSITVNDNYKIQIFNGDSETARKTLAEFKKQFKNFDGTVVFNTPVYKVWIGNFKTRIDAERNLAEIKKTYKNALLIRPNK